jgi:small subunit ribosomal protein S1
MSKPLKPQFSSNRVAKLLLKYNYQVKTGDILAGTIVGVERNQNLVNIGLKHVAFLPNREITIKTIINTNQILTINEIGDFVIIFYKNKTIVSLRRLHYLKLWERFKQIDLKNMILLAFIGTMVKTGKLVNFDGLNIYIPKSHISKFYRRKQTKLNTLPIKILEVKDKKHKIIGSSRLAFLKMQSPSLHLGLTQNGTVLTIKPYGILLNIYGIKCLLHISEIANRKIENIKKLYKKGDEIKVKVIYINTSQGKIAVSAREIKN